MVFNTVFAPKISKLFHLGKIEELKSIYVKGTRVLSIFSFLVVLCIFFGNEIILNIFGHEFVRGQTSLILRSLGQFVNIAVGSVWFMLSMTGEPKFQMYANIIAFVLNILLNFALIPIYGINGAAFASMITLMFINIMGYIIVSQRFKVKVFKFF